ncbi:hypothetical protein EMCG_00122 [[Emmonsia] crescens]|uniref:Uncharacterized protein n=1 Tax=[Emmonsia] crescens TaxID=73230 RepID=A0A0G2HUQ4_9EURO|nr:hypothetical protein EMCG_00122 [Emmonsia crescens UAMH 3008]
MGYLGVPRVIMDKDLVDATRKLKDAGFILSFSNCNAAPESMAKLPDSQAVLQQDLQLLKPSIEGLLGFEQIGLIPSLFASLPNFNVATESNETDKCAMFIKRPQYDTYGNILYPQQKTLGI